jgi:hypothetical protein
MYRKRARDLVESVAGVGTIALSAAGRASRPPPASSQSRWDPSAILTDAGFQRQVIKGDGNCSISAVVHQCIVAQQCGRTLGAVPTQWSLRTRHVAMLQADHERLLPAGLRNMTPFFLADAARQFGWDKNPLMSDLHRRLAVMLNIDIVIFDTENPVCEARYEHICADGSETDGVKHPFHRYSTRAQLQAAIDTSPNGADRTIYIEYVGRHFQSLVHDADARRLPGGVTSQSYAFAPLSADEKNAIVLADAEWERQAQLKRESIAADAASAGVERAAKKHCAAPPRPVPLPRPGRVARPVQLPIVAGRVTARARRQVVSAKEPPQKVVPPPIKVRRSAGGGYCNCDPCQEYAKKIGLAHADRGYYQSRNVRANHRKVQFIKEVEDHKGIPRVLRDVVVNEEEPAQDSGFWGT